jgi:hypothetical protein
MVAIAVVDALEEVDVDLDEGQRTLVGGGFGGLLGVGFIVETPIIQARKLVAIEQILGL